MLTFLWRVRALPALPADSLLQRHAQAGAFTDAYTLALPRAATLAEVIKAFYTSPLFRLELWLIARFVGVRTAPQDAQRLAADQTRQFSVWQVEARSDAQIALAAGPTRSWLQIAADGRTLTFGSAVLPREDGSRRPGFRALGGFHVLYSRLLLAAAGRRLR